ncbi:hypothetical protein PF005_g18432 [Phytophthora fragariae]|uniref:Uncharacterized protein n=1 Tax=Phytophthora fragariae TaxID=53985 RepID=A0A6A3R663_9STRA|nr:hypothetical protein PF003_g27823 [Phytophthora fragariae]KAE8926692.1 hypothetical protein PF009_g23126 [Phytophthora fragariae]KAE9090844.1 hypothetical protein PF007_g19092 [Phytophthora fragariae]KAE9121139.1 hypothetical protein PF006_g17972 [Phytophthora fragariae]KAE9192512.1 hypothetical protein PF005_g18432 [Phytophthora fragariae]
MIPLIAVIASVVTVSPPPLDSSAGAKSNPQLIFLSSSCCAALCWPLRIPRLAVTPSKSYSLLLLRCIGLVEFAGVSRL